jgi:hypothetical protein
VAVLNTTKPLFDQPRAEVEKGTDYRWRYATVWNNW